MKKTLTLLLLLLFVVSSMAQNHLVTASSLTVRDDASTQGKAIGTLKQGEKVYVESISNNWAQINYNGHKSYISASYIKAESISASNYSHESQGSSNIIFFVIIAAVVLTSLRASNRTVIYICAFSLPILLLILHTKVDPTLNFCKPDKVGWWQAIFAFIGFIAIVSVVWNKIKSIVKGEFRYFSNGFISFVASSILFLLYAICLCVILMQTLTEVTPMILLAILSMTGGDKYLGRFTDKRGRDWDVWEKG